MTTHLAFALLRPILRRLNVQYLSRDPVSVMVSDYPTLINAGMGKWVIYALKSRFTDGAKGCTTIIYDKNRDLFLLFIFVDTSLYQGDELRSRVQRKMIAVHEFVHGFAHMYLSSSLGKKNFIESMLQSMNKKLILTTSDEFSKMLDYIGKPAFLFTDSHFRLFGDGFNGDYGELNMDLLLSYQLTEETILNIRLQHSEVQNSISEILILTINELIETKALDKDFVLSRIAQFLSRLFIDFG